MRALLTVVCLSLFAAPALAGDLGLVHLDADTMATAKALAERDADMSFLADPGVRQAVSDLDRSLAENQEAMVDVVKAEREFDAAMAQMRAFLAENGDELKAILDTPAPAAEPAGWTIPRSIMSPEQMKQAGLGVYASRDARVADPKGGQIYDSLKFD